MNDKRLPKESLPCANWNSYPLESHRPQGQIALSGGAIWKRYVWLYAKASGKTAIPDEKQNTHEGHKLGTTKTEPLDALHKAIKSALIWGVKLILSGLPGNTYHIAPPIFSLI